MIKVNNKNEKAVVFHQFLWRFTAGWLTAAGGVLLAAVLTGGPGSLSWKLLLTCIGFAVGSLLMAIQIGALPKRSKMAAFGAVVIVISQVCFFLLIWTVWKQYSLLWRVWWVSLVPSVFVTHLLLLRSAALAHRGRVEQVTIWCVSSAGVLLLLLVFRYDFFAPLHPIYIGILAVPTLGTIAGTAYVTFRWVLGKVGTEQLSKRVVAGGMMMSHLLLLVLGFYIGRTTVETYEKHPGKFITKVPVQMKEKVENEIYKSQSRVATWLGDTRLVSRAPFISPEQVKEVSKKLRPGDIILERRNWYLSNPWLPGFWPHAALYVGHLEDLRKLGIQDHPSILKHLEEYSKRSEDGHEFTVIEAVSEGVVLSTLEHSALADYIAVLRPRITEKQRGAAIVRAFENLGKPYDFNFDFDDRDKLVCTQVVYLSYEGMVTFELKHIMGRSTLPANEIALKYVKERVRMDRQLDFVLFLDAANEKGTADFAKEEDFCSSVERPRALVER